MGIVKFGQQSLSIEQVPDGHIIISESDFSRMRDSSNALLTLRSKIPVGITEEQIAPLIEKGIKFDSVNNQVNSLNTKITELQANLDKFSNMPKDFTPERWFGYVKKEAAEKRQSQIEKLTSEVLADVEKEFGVKYVVDPRFIPSEVLDKFDPEHTDAKKQWRDILDKAHTEQQDFIKNQLESFNTSPGKVGSPPQDKSILIPNSGDKPDIGILSGFR